MAYQVIGFGVCMKLLYVFVVSISFVISAVAPSWADNQIDQLPAFSLHKHQSGVAGKTLLVVGGIQGDEPGGFHAASLLATHYTITKGTVWIVPNLNFPSIIKRSRGVYGDLNRKFASISAGDPEYVLVNRIKSIIVDPKVDVVMNLHDGSGFYRTTNVDDMHNTNRWGQSVIIDQEQTENKGLGGLGDIGRAVVAEVNAKIPDAEKRYSLKNTKTREGDEEMAKTLTYFAINNGKAAFGVEASKSLSKSERVFHHLQVLEAFMNQLGIEFTRRFDLDVASVGRAIDENRQIAFYDKRISLEMQNFREQIAYFPLEQASNMAFSTMDPLVTVIPQAARYDVYQGNERVTTLVPQYFKYDENTPAVKIVVDDVEHDISMGNIVKVKKTFKILPIKGYRVNVIGYSSPGNDESGVTISHQDFVKRYSLDNEGDVFRVEIYRSTPDEQGKDLFSGMVLVKFNGKDISTPSLATPLVVAEVTKKKILSQ